MKILMVTAEAAPFVRVGGLSQVIYFLSKELIKQGHDVRIFMPKYGVIKKSLKLKNLVDNLEIPFGKLHKNKVLCNIKVNQYKKNAPITYFLENKEYYELRANVFSYKDDHLRFLLLSRGCLEWLSLEQQQKDGWKPDIIHSHDWHTGYLADEIRRNSRYSTTFSKTPVLHTIHNLKYQGNTGFKHKLPKKQDKGTTPLNTDKEYKLVNQNPLLRGMLYSDWVNTVSKSHSLEIMTHEYGEGLEKIITKMKGKFSGILNGLDNKEFNPNTDPFLESNYSINSIEKRAPNKIELQKTFNLPEDKDIFLFGFVGRLSKQKGLDILIPVVEKILRESQAQFIFLGSGESEYKNQLTKLQKKFPDNVSVHLYPDFKLPRKIFSGSDAILIPSVFEPGGIVALESMRYGAVPIVRKTGGLADSVTDFTPHKKTGNGFSFKEFSKWSLFSTLVKAITIYQQPTLWKQLVTNAMKSDFSWKVTAQDYDSLYNKVIKQRKRFLSTNPHLAYDPLHKG
ncbi:MAG: glycogen synthase [Candidatus Pacebacteria bacterium]|jgi:starch synthase|nr:glycogen synthase [Candidatus Paceibacterota bacterium]MBT4652827.1 glycogen synthase [Candidatus Paceibacterota bacterium]MBT6756525.1 glycogen synthase [Candidatus Paceibacterota bacterium]MBT6921758.1 glycogen synthase [Candidatus Paceibacterota bacterium]